MARTSKSERERGVAQRQWWRLCDVEVPFDALVTAVVAVEMAQTESGCILRLTTREYSCVEHHEVAMDKSDPLETARRAVREAFLHRVLVLGRVTREGLLTRVELEKASAEASSEREFARAFQRRRPSNIIDVARELRLAPDTDGLVAGRWEARCPGTGHSLEIEAHTNLFRCGYCQVGGGPDELRSLVDVRRGAEVRG